MGHFATASESLKKTRSEFEDLCEVSQTATNRLDYLKKHCLSDICQDMTYLAQVTNECLRFMNPVPHSTLSVLSQDAMIGKYHIKAGDVVQVNINGLHSNQS